MTTEATPSEWFRPIDPFDVAYNIQANITNLMIDRGLGEYSSIETGKRVGIDPASWSRKRNGKTGWSIADLIKIGNYFGCTPAQLLTPGYGLDRLESNRSVILPD